jgi:hypothetical protein
MAIPVALRRRLGPRNVPRSVDGSLYKIDHLQRRRRFYSLPAVSIPAGSFDLRYVAVVDSKRREADPRDATTTIVEARAPRALASGGLAPHMAGMTSTENPQADASDHAAAIARWDEEGGAPRSNPRKNDAGAWKEPRRSGRNRTGINSGAELAKS